MQDEKTLRKQVNASGFPFQLRIEREVRHTYPSRHHWLPVALEHYWSNSGIGKEGFIDLVLQRVHPTSGLPSGDYDEYMIVECKRVKEGSWIFLKSELPEHEQHNAHILAIYQVPEQQNPVFEWFEANCDPASYSSSFCAVPGQADKQTPMLERISSELLNSLESLAEEAYDYFAPKSTSRSQQKDYRPNLFVPVIVTNAKLVLCTFEPNEIDLSKGVLEDSSGDFQDIPYIRFQKSLSTKHTTKEKPKNLKAANRLNERTIFVVSSPHLSTFLARWNVHGYGDHFGTQ